VALGDADGSGLISAVLVAMKSHETFTWKRRFQVVVR